MRTTIAGLALVVMSLVPCGSALGQSAPSAEMQADIRTLMELTGAGDLAVQVMGEVLGQMREALPSVPEEFWTRVMTKVDADELMDLMAPIYAKHFTHEEIGQLLAFYRTEIGQKVIATLPAVMHESMMAGQAWGERLARQVVEELRAEGYR